MRAQQHDTCEGVPVKPQSAQNVEIGIEIPSCSYTATVKVTPELQSLVYK